jgi:hypothetical protein
MRLQRSTPHVSMSLKTKRWYFLLTNVLIIAMVLLADIRALIPNEFDLVDQPHPQEIFKRSATADDEAVETRDDGTINNEKCAGCLDWLRSCTDVSLRETKKERRIGC